MDFSGGYIDLPFVAEFYDHVVPYRDRADVGFFVDEAARSGGPVLELGCGTGRVLIPIARSGCDIAGLGSVSPEARTRARRGSEACARFDRKRHAPAKRGGNPLWALTRPPLVACSSKNSRPIAEISHRSLRHITVGEARLKAFEIPDCG
jgi:SAM-dependent methyltransferase